VGVQVIRNVGNRLWNKFRIGLDDRLWGRFWSRIWDRLRARLKDRIYVNYGEKLEDTEWEFE